MRAAIQGGRFDIPMELREIGEGISTDLRREVGTYLDWYIYDTVNSVVDPIYDVGAYTGTGGRRWVQPALKIPAIRAVIQQGITQQNQRGYYQTGIMLATLNIKNVGFLLPDLLLIPDVHYWDRVVYQSTVFTPVRIMPKGHVAESYTVVTLQFNQVNSEEIVNDPQFQQYAT
jgi:hypothetical protein